MEDFEKYLAGWEIEELIGQGAYGKVYRLKKEELGYTYYSELKVIKIPSDEREALAETATPSFSNHTHLIADLSESPVLSTLTDSIVTFSEALKSTALNTTVATAGADLTAEE